VRFGLESEAGAARGSFELGGSKKQLTAQVAIRGGFLPPRATRAYAKELGAAADTLAGLLDAGLAAEVVALCEHLMKRLDTALGRVDCRCAARRAPRDSAARRSLATGDRRLARAAGALLVHDFG
jgi:hypothetical protein